MKAVFSTKYKNRRRGWKKGMLGKIQIHTLAFGPGGVRKNTNTDIGVGAGGVRKNTNTEGAGGCYRVSDTDGLH